MKLLSYAAPPTAVSRRTAGVRIRPHAAAWRDADACVFDAPHRPEPLALRGAIVTLAPSANRRYGSQLNSRSSTERFRPTGSRYSPTCSLGIASTYEHRFGLTIPEWRSSPCSRVILAVCAKSRRPDGRGCGEPRREQVAEGRTHPPLRCNGRSTAPVHVGGRLDCLSRSCPLALDYERTLPTRCNLRNAPRWTTCCDNSPSEPIHWPATCARAEPRLANRCGGRERDQRLHEPHFALHEQDRAARSPGSLL